MGSPAHRRHLRLEEATPDVAGTQGGDLGGRNHAMTAETPQIRPPSTAGSTGSAAESWVANAKRLATWAMQRLVNRTDVWGLYTRWIDDDGVEHGSMTAPARKHRGKVYLVQ